jgi:hypothetical protein
MIHADLAKSALQAYGITATTDGGLFGPQGRTIELIVRQEDVEEALKILGPEETFST